MDVETLGIQHKEMLTARLKGLGVSLSEYTFPNLFLFRLPHRYEVLTAGGEIFVRGTTYDGHRYLMPTTDARSIDPRVLLKALDEAAFFFPIPDPWLSAFPAAAYDTVFREGDADYLYTVERMSTYPGRRLHKKRNLLKQFTREYQHEAHPLAGDRVGHAQMVLEEWGKEAATDLTTTDFEACREALARIEELALCGGIVYADGEPAGFVLGEEVGGETYVLHFAKARTRFKGVYQYLFSSFASVLPSRYRYLNLEQDLDRENLRLFKSSYAPHALLRKARVYPSGRGGAERARNGSGSMP